MMKCVKKLQFAASVAYVATVCLILSHTTVFAAEVHEAPPEGQTASDGRPLYTEETRPSFPVFNSLVGEENFLHVTGPDGVSVTSGGADSLELQMGQEYTVTINYDNNGLPRGITTRAIANDTRVQVSFPFTLTDERTITATITARDSQPSSVSSSLTLIAAEPMALEPIQETARIVNDNPTNGSIISISDLFGNGVSIGTNSMIGIVMYGPENAGIVVFNFRTVPIEQATTKQTTDVSNQTTIIPTTKTTPEANGSNDWTLSGILGIGFGVLALVGMIAYLIHIWGDAKSRR